MAAASNRRTGGDRLAPENTGRLAGLRFPNGMGPLFGDTPDTAWSQQKAGTIIEALYVQLNS